MAAAALFASAPAQANQVVNGSFETSDFTGWTLFGDPVDLSLYVGVNHNPQDGSFGAYFGPQSPGGIR